MCPDLPRIAQPETLEVVQGRFWRFNRCALCWRFRHRHSRIVAILGFETSVKCVVDQKIQNKKGLESLVSNPFSRCVIGLDVQGYPRAGVEGFQLVFDVRINANDGYIALEDVKLVAGTGE